MKRDAAQEGGCLVVTAEVWALIWGHIGSMKYLFGFGFATHQLGSEGDDISLCCSVRKCLMSHPYTSSECPDCIQGEGDVFLSIKTNIPSQGVPLSQVMVHIMDENDCSPEFQHSIYTRDNIPETVPVGTSLLQGEHLPSTSSFRPIIWCYRSTFLP